MIILMGGRGVRESSRYAPEEMYAYVLITAYFMDLICTLSVVVSNHKAFLGRGLGAHKLIFLFHDYEKWTFICQSMMSTVVYNLIFFFFKLLRNAKLSTDYSEMEM